ncbi:MAG: DUF1786 domain-containing protein [Chloroflexi bacterium]|nr:DUF1786 domain-containing protein [Chloroflexota bacterium]
MRALCFDIGSGTQDILFLDTAQPAENAVQLVLPAPTVLVARKIEAATVRRQPVVLVGETMGGGACTGALRAHLDAGLKVYATENAARTFSDDLDKVKSWGVTFISEDEATRISGAVIEMKDIDLPELERALSHYEVKFNPDVLAVAVLDHGAAPPGQSERLFRFQYLERRLRENNSLERLVLTPPELPDFLTRMQAVVRTVAGKFPLVIMDTGPAAVLGALLDKEVASHPERVCVNLGNSHTLAFSLKDISVLGLFEHHTSALSLSRLEALIDGLVSGKLSLNEVWQEGGHGALVLEKTKPSFVAATGPRRALLSGSRLKPYLAAPFGSMMLAGCFGLARAIAIKLPQYREELEKTLLGLE